MSDTDALDAQYANGHADGYTEGRTESEMERTALLLQLKSAYTERARLLAYIALWHDAHVGFNDQDELDWPVLTIETSAGQMTWHIAPEDGHLLSHVRHSDVADRGWDGHTTAEKYERLERLILTSIEGVEE